MIANLPKSVDWQDRDRIARKILTIINQLEKVKAQTTVYEDAVTIMNFANQKSRELRR